MIAVILAAGVASRLRPLTDHTPKCLLKIGEKCLLQRSIDALIANGIDEVVIVTGYLEGMIERFLYEQYPGLKKVVIFNERYQTTNNIYSLWCARTWADGSDILLLDSDIIFHPDIVKRLLECKHPDALALNNHPLGEEEIKVIADADGCVKEISKICSINDAIGESIGIEKMSAAYTTALYAELRKMIGKEGLDNVFYELAFERLIPQSFTFHVLDTTDLFSIELDTVDDFNQARQLIPAELF